MDVDDKTWRELLFKPKTMLITGDQGSGKSFWTSLLAYEHIRLGGFVISNVALVKWDAEQEREVEGEYERYTYAQSFAELFIALASILVKDRNAHVLCVIDEGAINFHAMSYASYLSITLRSFITVCRKLHVSTAVVALRPELLLTALRDDEGLIQVRFAKEPRLLRKHAQDALDEGYTPKQLVLVEWKELDIDFDSEPVTVLPTKAIAVPADTAKENGAVYMDTGQISTFELGKHPMTGKPFDLVDLLANLRGISWDMPEKLHAYMFQPSKIPDIDLNDVEDEPAPAKKSAKKAVSKAVSTIKHVQADVDAALKAGIPAAKIAKDTGCSERYVWERKRFLRESGELR